MFALTQHVADDLALGVLSKAEVDKTRSRDFDAVDERGCLGVIAKCRGDAFADCARILLEAASKLQRARAGDIAVRGILGTFEDDFGIFNAERVKRFRNKALQGFFLLSEHIGK